MVGLLQLLTSEIEYNIAVTQSLEFWWYQKGGSIDTPPSPRLKAEVWIDVRRVAQLLPEDIITALNDYYSPLYTVLTHTDQKEQDSSNLVMRDVLADRPERMYPNAPPFDYPDYAQHVLEAQNTAHKQVKDYLDLTPLMRYPIRGWTVEFVFRKRGGNDH
jgi:hypothetical protein